MHGFCQKRYNRLQPEVFMMLTAINIFRLFRVRVMVAHIHILFMSLYLHWLKKDNHFRMRGNRQI